MQVAHSIAKMETANGEWLLIDFVRIPQEHKLVKLLPVFRKSPWENKLIMR